jgi:hypothetical protein
MPCSSRGQSQSGQRGGSSYTSTVRSQYGQSPSRIAGGCPVSFGIGVALGGSGPLLHRQYPAYLESGRDDGRIGGSRSRPRRSRTCNDPPGGRVVAGGELGPARRLPSPCGCGACRAQRTCEPVRAASSSPTCCRSKAWSYIPEPHICDRTGTACWPSGATGPTGPGNSPPPSRSRPFVALTEGRLVRRPCRVIRTMTGTGSFLVTASEGRPSSSARWPDPGSKMLLIASEVG